MQGEKKNTPLLFAWLGLACTHQTNDILLSIAFCKLTAVEDVARFACAVLLPCCHVILVGQVLHVYASYRRVPLLRLRRYPNHTHAVWRGELRSSDKQRGKQFGEEERPKVVNSQLQFVALLCRAALRRNHDARIVPQYVESRLALQEALGRRLDPRQVVEDELEKH